MIKHRADCVDKHINSVYLINRKYYSVNKFLSVVACIQIIGNNTTIEYRNANKRQIV